MFFIEKKSDEKMSPVEVSARGIPAEKIENNYKVKKTNME